jgi:hypothetical protein
MIELKVKEYCQNCPDFAAKVSVREHDSGDMINPIKLYDTTVTCSHAKRCEGMVRFLDKTLKDVNNIASDTK